MKFLAITLLSLAAALPVAAQNKGDDHSSHHGAAAKDVAAEMYDGEVRRINADVKKITLRHGEMKDLDMPAMTMVFNVRDPAMLDRVKVGDKVRFTAEKTVGGEFFVTRIEPAR